MRVIDHLEKAQETLFSFEIIPPARGRSAREILDIVEQVQQFNPPFIDVTSHSAEANYEEHSDGSVIRRIRRKRPGTLSICGIIQNRYNIDTVAHLLCRGFTKEESEDALIELNYLGIHNVLAVRGDEVNFRKRYSPDKTHNQYATDLVEQIQNLKRGQYLEELINAEPINMCVGVGGYPEKHYEAPNIKEDIRRLKMKVEAGADYIVTQMFFDNLVYFKFVERCRQEGIQVPIIPGIKILDTEKQLSSLPRKFHITLPEALVDEVTHHPEQVKKIGVSWCIEQVRELAHQGVPNIHFYIMNDAALALKVIKGFRG